MMLLVALGSGALTMVGPVDWHIRARRERVDEALGGVVGYRPALDGVRAIAVLLVVAIHLRLPGAGAGAGAVGVGMFFALSGFLITTLLLEEHAASGRVSLSAFYVRRAARLLPALFVMLAVVAVAAVALGRRHVPLEAIAAAGYVGNWANISDSVPWVLGHTWSLAIEEHFYLLWPLVFIAAARRGRRVALQWAIVLAGLSLLTRLALYAAGASELRLQYGSDTRAESIMIGCAAALIMHGRRLPRWAGPASWTVLVTLIAFPAKSPTMLTFGLTVLALAGSVAAVDAAQGVSALTRLLQWHPLVALGRVSYGFYLWHVPVIRLLRPHLPAQRSLTIPVLLLITITLTTLSWVLVERPCLRWKNRRAARRRVSVTPVAA